MGAGLVGMVQAMGPVQFWICTAIAAIVTVTGFCAAFRHLSRARILEDIPTSRVRSAPQGYVELEGVCRLLDGPPIVAPLSGTPCTWWDYTIEKRSRDRHRHWRTVRSAASEELFALDDGSGQCIVDPEGAEVFATVSTRWYGDSSTPSRKPAARRFGRGRYRYTERRMHAGDPLYAIGRLHTRYASQPWDSDEEVAALLRQWKRDRADLIGRFDRDGDGELDLEEWDAVRAAARREVRREPRAFEARPGLSILAAPGDGRPYLLGAMPQPQLAARLRRRALGGLLSFAVAGVGLGVLITGRFGL